MQTTLKNCKEIEMTILIKTDQSPNEILKDSSNNLLGFWEEEKFVPDSGQMILSEKWIDGVRYAEIVNAD